MPRGEPLPPPTGDDFEALQTSWDACNKEREDFDKKVEEMISRLPPSDQTTVRLMRIEIQSGTHRMTQAALGIKEHSANLVFWNKVLVVISTILAILTAALITRTFWP